MLMVQYASININAGHFVPLGHYRFNDVFL